MYEFDDEISGGPREPEPREPRPPHRVKAVAWGTLGVLGVAAAAAAVYATTLGGGPSVSPAADASGATVSTDTSPSATASPEASGSTSPGHGRRGDSARQPARRGGIGGLGGLGLGAFGGDVLHGEATVKTKDGGTKIVDEQTGTISAVDASAQTLTVTSSDTAAFSYVVDSATRVVDFDAAASAKATLADLKVGDTVRVIATRDGDTRTATAIIDGAPKPPARPTARPTARPSSLPTAWPSMKPPGKGGGWGGFGHGPHPVPLATPSASGASA